VKTFQWLVGASSLCLLIGSALPPVGPQGGSGLEPIQPARARLAGKGRETSRSDQARASVGGDIRHGAVRRLSRSWWSLESPDGRERWRQE
jgi:hypothetical protein